MYSAIASYASDGASAVEIALKMSFHAWRNSGKSDKQEFVCLKGSYHGETIGALAVTDVPMFRDAYGPMLQHAHVMPAPMRVMHAMVKPPPMSHAVPPPNLKRCCNNAPQIAAIIVEPLVQCATGMAMYDPVYLQEIARAVRSSSSAYDRRRNRSRLRSHRHFLCL
jgi:adenosylmethionine-8-amino-7-oxononanoate aminotransferase